MSVLSLKHFIGLENATGDDIQNIIDTGFTFREILDRPIKKVPSLRRMVSSPEIQNTSLGLSA